MIRRSFVLILAAISVVWTAGSAWAELRLPAIFSDSMVVQREKPIHIWGWTTPGQNVSVTLADRSANAVADASGRFDVNLPSLIAGGPFELVIEADEKKVIEDVLIGEVWICSGQSNMAWPVSV